MIGRGVLPSASVLRLWNYQNLMIWLSQKSDREFCFAVPASPVFPLFVSMRDAKNPYGDSTMGVYCGRDFYFTVPGEILEWGPVPETGFDYAGSIKALFGFELQLLSAQKNAYGKKLSLLSLFRKNKWERLKRKYALHQ